MRAAAPDHRLPYLCVCLAQHCYWGGLRYSLLQAIAGPGKPISHIFDSQVPPEARSECSSRRLCCTPQSSHRGASTLSNSQTCANGIASCTTGIASALALMSIAERSCDVPLKLVSLDGYSMPTRCEETLTKPPRFRGHLTKVDNTEIGGYQLSEPRNDVSIPRNSRPRPCTCACELRAPRWPPVARELRHFSHLLLSLAGRGNYIARSLGTTRGAL